MSPCRDSGFFVCTNKQRVIISLAIKLNHIPGKGNVAVFFFFKRERRMHFWKSRHKVTTGNVTITPLWQEKFMFCWIKTVLISQSPVASTLLIWSLNICVQIVLVTWSSYVRICLWWCLFPSSTPQGEFWLAVKHRTWELVIHSQNLMWSSLSLFWRVWSERQRVAHGGPSKSKWTSDLLELLWHCFLNMALESEGSGLDSVLCQLLWTGRGQQLLSPVSL